MARQERKNDRGPGSTFKVGGIALAFLIIGYQASLFIHRAAQLRIESLRDRPDTVYVIDEALASRLLAEESGDCAPGVGALADRIQTASGSMPARPRAPSRLTPSLDSSARSGRSGLAQCDGGSKQRAVVIRRNAEHSGAVQQVRRATRRVETFRFNPNTVSVEDLIRLGFSEKQALAIDGYRQKGGRFRRPSDFARSYVVADSVFRRLEPFIDIPKLDLNSADSAAFDALPGIGPYFAARMVQYRDRLGGYSDKRQLLEIYNFGQERYDGLSDLVFCSPAQPFRLWSLPEDSLRLHPHIRSRQVARSIVIFRDNTPREQWSVDALEAAGILTPEEASRLRLCRLE